MPKSKAALTKSPRGSTRLGHYDPKKGIKQIAVYDMAVKYYARAKDARPLAGAIRAKLEAQADFVLWWDRQAEKNLGAAQQRGNRSVTALTLGRNGLPDKMTISRWRAKLRDNQTFERTYAQACAKYHQLLEFEKSAHVTHNSGEIEWYTPSEYIEAARTVMDGIDLDPASSVEANEIVRAGRIYTLDDDGLQHAWAGRVWMNPPYAPTLVKQFTAKLVKHYIAHELEAAIVLVNNATETQWFRAMADVADVICFKTGRIQFRGQNAAATGLQGQAFLYFGVEPQRFIQAFREFGFVMMPAEYVCRRFEDSEASDQ